MWLVYLAVEPYARRLRPWTLVSWTRFLGGGFSRPVVGRDALVGLAWAVLVFFLSPLRYVLPPLFGQPPPEPSYGYLDALLGAGPAPLRRRSAPRARASSSRWGCCCSSCCSAAAPPRRRSRPLALVVILLLPSALGAGEAAWFTLPVLVVWTLTWILLLLRFGLLAAIVGPFVYEMLYVFPLTTDLPSWKAGPTLLALPLLALLAVAAFRNALGGTGLRRYLAPEPSSRP